MAVTLANPIIVPAADASASTIVSNSINITAIVWDGGDSAANGDNAVVQDKNGVAKWAATLLTGNLVPMPFTPAEPVVSDGLKVPTLDHGTLYIYHTGPRPVA